MLLWCWSWSPERASSWPNIFTLWTWHDGPALLQLAYLMWRSPCIDWFHHHLSSWRRFSHPVRNGILVSRISICYASIMSILISLFVLTLNPNSMNAALWFIMTYHVLLYLISWSLFLVSLIPELLRLLKACRCTRLWRNQVFQKLPLQALLRANSHLE